MKRLFYSFCLVLLGISFVSADGEFTQDAVAGLKEKIVELQNRGELKIDNLTACSKISGFGSYVALPENKLKNGERFLVYLEPVNYFTRKSDLRYEINISEDMLVLNEKGDILWGKEDAVVYNYTSRAPVLDLFITNAIDLKGLPVGKYAFRAIVKDKLKGKSTNQSIFFEVTE